MGGWNLGVWILHTPWQNVGERRMARAVRASMPNPFSLKCSAREREERKSICGSAYCIFYPHFLERRVGRALFFVHRSPTAHFRTHAHSHTNLQIVFFDRVPNYGGKTNWFGLVCGLEIKLPGSQGALCGVELLKNVFGWKVKKRRFATENRCMGPREVKYCLGCCAQILKRARNFLYSKRIGWVARGLNGEACIFFSSSKRSISQN